MVKENIFLRIGFNTVIQIAGKIISVILSIFTVVLITRYLGTEGYGNFALVFTYVSFFSVISDFGLQLAMVRELSQNENEEKPYGSFLLLKSILILLSSLIAIITLFFLPYVYPIKLGIFIAIIAVAFSGITNYGTSIFQSRIRLDLVTYIDVLTKIFTVGFIIFFVYMKLNLYFIISTVLIGNSIGLAITFFLLKETFYFKYDKSQIKKILTMSFPIGITSFVGLAYFKVDTIMLSVMKNPTEVGLYTLSYKVLENFVLIWGFYMASVYPLFAKFKGESSFNKMNKLLINSFFIAILISTLIIIFGIIFAPFIIDTLAGKEFDNSINSLRILLFSIPFLFINNLLSDFCIVLKAIRIIFIGILISLIINILLNLWLIPLYGFIGASYVTVISAIILSAYSILTIIILKLPYNKIN